MSDMRDDLRELLQRRADGVPPHRDVPRSLVARARRRVALNALGVGLAVAVAAGGVFAGLRAFDTAPAPQPAGKPHPSTVVTSPPPTSPPPAAVTACTGSQLRAVGSMQGAAGSLEGGVSFTNFSDRTCTVQGRPGLVLLDQNHHLVTGYTLSSSPPGWKANASPKPAGWPVVKLRPGASAMVRIRWSNWCPQGRAAPLWRFPGLGGGSVDVVNGMEMAPPCNGPGQPATIEEGPFEAATGA
jgi:hypothetical protein